VLGIVNRHPTLDIDTTFALRRWRTLRPVQARMLGGSNPLAANTLDEVQVTARPAPLPKMRGDRLISRLPALSVTVLTLEASDAPLHGE
jgi:alpha-L-arabinofuranosidase